eukprot:CAMPEP_0169274886 /NCGR_PEP_ID=MMETSP1016-20121227/51990_1 /TAXON_ID=342587 /ORGANISM="Karlodinium micrum, Strain CCMP2283" /LENGTH=162 /DNA_ID=CAMNT_0009361529 /DNA_START=497 /DNA_END=985 /DNA_ORIENTATION=+
MPIRPNRGAVLANTVAYGIVVSTVAVHDHSAGRHEHSQLRHGFGLYDFSRCFAQCRGRFLHQYEVAMARGQAVMSGPTAQCDGHRSVVRHHARSAAHVLTTLDQLALATIARTATRETLTAVANLLQSSSMASSLHRLEAIRVLAHGFQQTLAQMPQVYDAA